MKSIAWENRWKVITNGETENINLTGIKQNKFVSL